MNQMNYYPVDQAGYPVNPTGYYPVDQTGYPVDQQNNNNFQFNQEIINIMHDPVNQAGYPVQICYPVDQQNNNNFQFNQEIINIMHDPVDQTGYYPVDQQNNNNFQFNQEIINIMHDPVNQAGYHVDQTGYHVDQTGYPVDQTGYPVDQTGYPVDQQNNNNFQFNQEIINIMHDPNTRDSIRYNFFLNMIKKTPDELQSNLNIAQNLLNYLINNWKDQLNAYKKASQFLDIKADVDIKKNTFQNVFNSLDDLNKFNNPVDTSEIMTLLKLENQITSNEIKVLRHFIGKLASLIVQSYEMFIGTYDHCSRTNKFSTLEDRIKYLEKHIKTLEDNIENKIKNVTIDFKGNQKVEQVHSFFLNNNKLSMKVYK
jgi:hypothetical protein